MNDFIRNFFEDMNRRKIRYCHWKSNNTLGDALEGIGDLDLLIDYKQERSFSELVTEYGFKIAHDPQDIENPYVYHYFSVDPATGLLVHLHVYFKLITGGSILKNHRIPVEELFLSQSSTNEFIVPTPPKEADLILFVIRKMIEQPSTVEHLLFWKDRANIDKELDWLTRDIDMEKLDHYLKEALPQLPSAFFHRCLAALKDRAPAYRRVILGLRMNACFPHTVYPPLIASIMRSWSFGLIYIKWKLKIYRPGKVLFPGGKIIAFVGPEASGKSTLSKETSAWLGKNFDVTHVHLGKPPKSLIALCLSPAIWMYSKLKRALGKSRQEDTAAKDSTHIEETYRPHPVICWLDALNRAAMVKKLVRKAMKGGIVITDRFPTATHGAIDSARIHPTNALTRILAKWEATQYKRLPLPDLVIKAIAPLDLTKKRNAAREKPEPENFLEHRYEQAVSLAFPPDTPCFEIDTTRTLEESLLEIQNIVWFYETRQKP